MARIRTIKPDFWTDGAMVQLSPFARLLYIGMWNFTMCDHGHVADDAMKLKLQILPMDNVDINALLAEIMDAGRVTRIEDAEGRKYLYIKRFEDHQKIDPRWKTRCSACAQKDSLKPSETPVSLSELPDTHPDSQQLTLGREGMGRDGRGRETKLSSPAAPSKDFETFWSIYPKKTAKQLAIKAWNKAAKTTDPQNIIAGATRYAQAMTFSEKRFIKSPDGWLNAGRWEDEVAAPEPQLTSSEQRIRTNILRGQQWQAPLNTEDVFARKALEA